ncbi:MAG: helical backbone metal receptor, partial [Candidatus Hydrogenedentota bacterium]
MLRAYSNFVLPIGIAAIFAASFGLRQGTLAERVPRARDAGPPVRIVSLAPSATEVLFAIGAGDRMVGVTRFCKYPPEAQTKTSIGGFMDTNYEAIVALRPDLVVLLAIHGTAKDRLEALGVSTLEMDHRTLDGILGSIRTAGEVIGAEAAANALIADIESRLDAVSKAVEGADRPRVLLSSGRTPGPLTVVYAAG